MILTLYSLRLRFYFLNKQITFRAANSKEGTELLVQLLRYWKRVFKTGQVDLDEMMADMKSVAMDFMASSRTGQQLKRQEQQLLSIDPLVQPKHGRNGEKR